VSLPGFDSNLFAEGISTENYQKILNDKNLPMFNRAIAGTYPPGSTVKPMLAASALQEGAVKDTTVIQDRGVLVIPNQYDPSIKYNFFGWKHTGLGAMTVRSAIAESSDIYFYTVAGGHPNSPNVNAMGAEKVAEYYKKFNLGNLTNIDIPGEKSGLVPTPDWKAAYFKNDPILSKWYLGDTYHIAIGQGDVLATPLQVAEWTATIANGGVGYEPQVLNNITDSETGKVVFQNQPKVLINRFIDNENIKIVQEGMRMTVTQGTARALNTLSVTSAGKTGTSQFDGSDPTRTHAWFTAYAPYEDPQIVITVLVEAGGEGNAISEPVVKEVLDWWSKNRYKKN
jgi:penicillin-binding protein 2